MSAINRPEPWALGTKLRIKQSGYKKAKVVEIRGNLGPGGARIYRMLVRRKPTRAYIEVREDQLEPLPPEA